MIKMICVIFILWISICSTSFVNEQLPPQQDNQSTQQVQQQTFDAPIQGGQQQTIRIVVDDRRKKRSLSTGDIERTDYSRYKKKRRYKSYISRKKSYEFSSSKNKPCKFFKRKLIKKLNKLVDEINGLCKEETRRTAKNIMNSSASFIEVDKRPKLDPTGEDSETISKYKNLKNEERKEKELNENLENLEKKEIGEEEGE